MISTARFKSDAPCGAPFLLISRQGRTAKFLGYTGHVESRSHTVGAERDGVGELAVIQRLASDGVWGAIPWARLGALASMISTRLPGMPGSPSSTTSMTELFRTFWPNRQLDSKFYDNYALCTLAAPHLQ